MKTIKTYSLSPLYQLAKLYVPKLYVVFRIQHFPPYHQFFFNGHREKEQTLSTAYKKHKKCVRGKSFSHEGSSSNSLSTDTQQLQNVINLSSKTLTDTCLSALSKGRSFIPTTYCGLSQVLLDLKTEKKAYKNLFNSTVAASTHSRRFLLVLILLTTHQLGQDRRMESAPNIVLNPEALLRGKSTRISP